MRRLPGERTVRRRVLRAAAGALAVLALAGCAGTAPATAPRTVDALTYRTVDGTALKADACLPKRTTPASIVVIVHGGGFTEGSRSDLAWLCQAAAAAGYAAFSIDYRLAPGTVYPGQIDDVAAAIRWVTDEAQVRRFDLDRDRLALVGDSAGAVLSAQVATGIAGSAAAARRVDGVVLLSGVYDFRSDALTPTLRGLAQQYYGCASACGNVEESSPEQHLTASVPRLLVVGSRNEWIPVAQATELQRRATAAGVRSQLHLVDGVDHAATILQNHPDAAAAVKAFLRSVLRP